MSDYYFSHTTKNPDAEQIVIGSVLIGGKRALSEISGYLLPEHFSNKDLGVVYSEMMAHEFKDGEIDVAILQEAVKGKVNDFPATRQAMLDGMERTVTAANIKYDAEIVVNGWKERKARAAIETFQADEADTTQSRLLSLADTLNGIAGYGSSTEVIPFKSALMEAYKNMVKPLGKDRLQLGLSSLDKMLGGMEKTDYCIIAAQTSVGKTAFVAQAVRRWAMLRKKVVYFSLEMPKQQIIERMFANSASVPLSDIRERRCLEDKGLLRKLADTATELYELGIDIQDSGKLTPSDVLRLTRGRGYDAIVIDHLGLMQATGRPENRNQEVSKISRDLRMIAMQTKTPVIALCQLNRAVAARAEKQVVLSDLRDSGSIEQDATHVIGLSVKQEHGGGRKTIRADVLKNRNGPCGYCLLDFIGEYQRFLDYDNTHEEPAFVPEETYIPT